MFGMRHVAVDVLLAVSQPADRSGAHSPDGLRYRCGLDDLSWRLASKNNLRR